MTPSAPSSQPPFGTESRWLPTITVRSDWPGSVAQLLPAASISGVMPSVASLALNQVRASRHTGPQAKRCAPSAFEVCVASSRRSAMTSRALIGPSVYRPPIDADWTQMNAPEKQKARLIRSRPLQYLNRC